MSVLAIDYSNYKRVNSIKQFYESPLIRLVNAKRIEDAELFFNLLHGNSYKENETKFIVFANAYTKSNSNKLGWEQWGFKTEDINYNFLSSFLTLENCYMTVNNFVTPKRRNDKCYQITSFYVDLDYYNITKYKNKTCEEMINIMRKQGLFKGLEPSFFVDSGNGMYIYYLLDPTLNGQLENLRYVWSKTEEALIKRFESFGADSQVSDLARVTRMPGSINGKTGRIARIIYNTEKTYNYNPKVEIKKYKLKEMTDILLDTKEKEKKVKADNTKRATYRGAIVLNWSINVAYKRCEDIKKLVELRGSCKGNRDYICLLFRYSLLHQNFGEEESLQETIKLAMTMKDFGEDFDEDYIEQATKPTVRYYQNFLQAQKDYEDTDKSVTFNQFVKNRSCMLWTNAKMIDKLSITQEEMKYMKTLYNSKEKNRRNRENYNPLERKEKYKKSLEKKGKMTKEQEIEMCIKKMKDLLAQGLSSTEIMQVLNLTKPTYYRYKKQIKN